MEGRHTLVVGVIGLATGGCRTREKPPKECVNSWPSLDGLGADVFVKRATSPPEPTRLGGG